jgi:hypothetical protein
LMWEKKESVKNEKGKSEGYKEKKFLLKQN